MFVNKRFKVLYNTMQPLDITRMKLTTVNPWIGILFVIEWLYIVTDKIKRK